MASNGDSKVVLSTGQWVSLLATVATLVAAGVWGAHLIESRLSKAMIDLDHRWQVRAEAMTRELRADIRNVEAKIPPDWFRRMVEDNEKDIKRLESEFTRDFIRKNELEMLLRTVMTADDEES